jgi:hypothetical protein
MKRRFRSDAMTDETLGALLAQWFVVASSVAFAVGIGMGFWMSTEVHGSADDRTERLFNMICSEEQ